MKRFTLHGTATAVCALSFVFACSDEGGPAEGTGGASTGGAATGGMASGGATTGGTTAGGSGGVTSGGSESGGGTGGEESGGSGGESSGGTGGGGEEIETIENGLPRFLSDTPLYEDDMATLMPGVRYFQPRFPLWTDGAKKRRYIYMPEDTQIDTSDMDFWEFPDGTWFWKDFVREDVDPPKLVETRVLHRNDRGRWVMVAYLWNEDGTDAEASVAGESNASGTDHDVPSEEACWDCHTKIPQRAIGFSAIELAHDGGSDPDGDPEWTLQSLQAEGILTDAPPSDEDLTLPGTEVEQTALAYLHANCAHCHHSQSTLGRTPINFQLVVDGLDDVSNTPTYETTVDQPNSLPPSESPENVDRIVDPGNLDNSMIWVRYQDRGGPYEMPPLGVEISDPAALSAMQEWIEFLAPPEP